MTFFENKYGFGIGGGLVLLKPLGIVLIGEMGVKKRIMLIKHLPGNCVTTDSRQVFDFSLFSSYYHFLHFVEYLLLLSSGFTPFKVFLPKTTT